MELRAAEKVVGSRDSVVRLGRSLGEAPPLQQPRARLISPLPVRRLGASAKCLGTRSCSQGTIKVVTPGNFCTDYFCAWDSPAPGLLAQRGRAPPPRSASSPGWRAAARESRSCTRMSVPPCQPAAPAPPQPRALPQCKPAAMPCCKPAGDYAARRLRSRERRPVPSPQTGETFGYTHAHTQVFT